MGSCFSVEEEPELQPHNKPNNIPVGHGVLTPPRNLDRPEVPGADSTNSGARIPRDVMDLRKSTGSSDIDIFSYEEMRLATKHFRPNQVLGEGGFGIVYKGVIDENVRPGYKSTSVAIKELDPESLQGDREWLAEVNYLGQLRHSNLVKLIGYCCEDEHRLLVYEYMASGSLEKHLFSKVSATLSWSKRLKIALDAAKGLEFLHSADRPIIYRDLKTSNILLDADFNAKLSDFGLAKDGPMGDQTHVSTRVMGTYGYAAPEYVMTGHLTARSDVYGFGVVLLEMLIGRKAMDKSRPSREHNLVEWARPLLNHHKKLLRILDPKIEGQYSTRIVVKVANLAYQCLSQNPRGRPLMNQVVEILEALHAQARSRREVDILQSGVGSVTLFEVPKGVPVKPLETQKPLKTESERGIDASSPEQPNKKNKSEPLSALFEVPKGVPVKPLETQKPLKTESERGIDGSSPEQPNKKNKSEPLPAKDVDLYSPSFDDADLDEDPVSTEVEVVK